VEWLAKQEWCSGRVGTFGSSHRAITQQQLVLHSPPHLAAILPEVGPTNIFAHEAREGGAFCFAMFAALHMHALDSHELRGNPGGVVEILDAMADMPAQSQRTPFRLGETALRHTPSLEQTLLNYYTRGAYDEWWAQEACDQEAHWERHADVPTFIAGGGYDQFVGGPCRYYETLRRQNKSPTKLVVGPWNHGGMREDKSWAGEVDFGPASVWGGARYNTERLAWFRRFLFDEAEPSITPAERAAARESERLPVHIFVMGTGDGRRTEDGRFAHGGYWRAEPTWPLARAAPQTLFLHCGGQLSPSAPPAAGETSRSFTFDPARPVPTLGGAVVGGLMGLLPAHEGGPVSPFGPPAHLDQAALWRANFKVNVAAGPMHQQERPGLMGCTPPFRRLCDRPDVLTFETEPLPADLEVTGTPEVSIFVSSSALDTDITVKLLDLAPPSAEWPEGFDLNLTDTVLRLRYREGWTADREALLEPGAVYEVAIKLWPISNVFQKGHRVRLDVSSSNFPRLDTNPNSGEPVGRHTRLVLATNTVHSDAARPSRLVLPVVPIVASSL
jgi:predicted acyl esterase